MFYFLFLTNFLKQRVCYEELKFSPDKTLIADTDWPVKTAKWPAIANHQQLFAALGLAATGLKSSISIWKHPDTTSTTLKVKEGLLMAS